MLQSQSVRLEPLTLAHAPALHRFSPPDTFRYFTTRPADESLDAFTAFLADHLADPTRRAFAVIDAATGEPVGSSSFLDLRSAHRGAEIGFTWYAPNVRGTRINPETKLLLLEHAFGPMNCIRVQLKCDDRNEHSKRAILKLGATFEGVLRKHMVTPGGFIRDTAFFSILADEWPTVRTNLLRRIA